MRLNQQEGGIGNLSTPLCATHAFNAHAINHPPHVTYPKIITQLVLFSEHKVVVSYNVQEGNVEARHESIHR